jgi:hypothetical protein
MAWISLKLNTLITAFGMIHQVKKLSDKTASLRKRKFLNELRFLAKIHFYDDIQEAIKNILTTCNIINKFCMVEHNTYKLMKFCCVFWK